MKPHIYPNKVLINSVDFGTIVRHNAIDGYHSKNTKTTEIHLVQFTDVALLHYYAISIDARIFFATMGCT